MISTVEGGRGGYGVGIVKAIRVSNLCPDRLTKFNALVEVEPMVNQVEVNSFFQQSEAIKLVKSKEVNAAWIPFAGAKGDIFTDEVLKTIVKKCGKSMGQVILQLEFLNGEWFHWQSL